MSETIQETIQKATDQFAVDPVLCIACDAPVVAQQIHAGEFL